MDRIIGVTTIDEEFEKAQVKGFIRTRKGKMERVNPFERKGEKRVREMMWHVDRAYKHPNFYGRVADISAIEKKFGMDWKNIQKLVKEYKKSSGAKGAVAPSYWLRKI